MICKLVYLVYFTRSVDLFVLKNMDQWGGKRGPVIFSGNRKSARGGIGDPYDVTIARWSHRSQGSPVEQLISPAIKSGDFPIRFLYVYQVGYLWEFSDLHRSSNLEPVLPAIPLKTQTKYLGRFFHISEHINMFHQPQKFGKIWGFYFPFINVSRYFLLFLSDSRPLKGI